jgi:hypothetical protein
MRTPNNSTAFYEPADPPADPVQLQMHLRTEQQKVAAVVNLLVSGHLDKTTVAPAKPRDGDIRYADGVLWNPGGTGKGLYMFTTVWTLIKALP